MGKSIKKVVFLAMALIVLGIFFSSCKTREKCPAYGETHKFQIEQKY